MSRGRKVARTTRKPALRARSRLYWSPDRFLGEMYKADPAVRIIWLDYRRAEFGIIKFAYRIAGEVGVTEVAENPYTLNWWAEWFAKHRDESKESA